ncbi:hypothetical protein DYD21_19550 [Rhodohalobacter sp. SW132]|uniref:hypothetical protein n=1 Tax=Rhodohalobacter sp. SW132 TaxID=2293433 RepID=UPI000E23FBD4|nr:hypothetical protein [Rhodohalobacter sp. SW132]REL24177.1 hypothetical protein DYD21_19550 [Rhodohalobacter sp. SW132]
MIKTIKKGIKSSFEIIGYELKQKQRNGSKTMRKSSLPVMYDDVIEALHCQRGGTQVSFTCPIQKCVHRTGLNFFEKSWHPFVEVLKEYETDNDLTYGNSILKKFYERWQPRSAAEALVGIEPAPVVLKRLPPHLVYLTPWSSRTPKRMDKIVRSWHKGDDIEHGKPHFSIEEHGFRDYGPVSDEKGQLEFDRLINVYRSISESGYDRSHGDIEVLVLKRGEEFRFINKGGGYHRAAAMAALGHKTVPAKFFDPWIITLEDIEYWPQVRTGVWGKEEAENYFHHLFDFNNREWAKRVGLMA